MQKTENEKYELKTIFMKVEDENSYMTGKARTRLETEAKLVSLICSITPSYIFSSTHSNFTGFGFLPPILIIIIIERGKHDEGFV